MMLKSANINRIDRENQLPLYCQLREILRRQIDAGALKPGDQLPPEPALGQTYGLSRITVRQALADLVDEGYVSRSRGKGTFVAERKLQDRRVNRIASVMETLREQGYDRTPGAGDRRVPTLAEGGQPPAGPGGHSVIHVRRLVYRRTRRHRLATGYIDGDPGHGV